MHRTLRGLVISAFDLNGKRVYVQKEAAVKGDYRHELDLSGQPEGVYLIQVSDGERSFSQRVVISK